MNMIKKILGIFSTIVITCMCLGCITIFASSNTYLKTGTNFGLANTGTSKHLFVTISDVKYAKSVGANYSFKSIANNTTKYKNYVRTIIEKKTVLGKWKELVCIDANMPTTGHIYCPRNNLGYNERVYGLKYYAFNNFKKGDAGYGNIADCATSLAQGYDYAS